MDKKKGPVPKDPADRFRAKICVDDATGCWNWTGARDRRGYGAFFYPVGKKRMLAHRYSYYLKTGNLRQDEHICHSCDNPSCVNPAHLFAGTAKDNMEDCKRKGRLNTPQRPSGCLHPRSKLTGVAVLKMRTMHKSGCYSQRELARKFGMSQCCVGRVVRHETYLKEE